MAETDTHRTFEESEDDLEQIEYELGPEQIYGQIQKLATMASTTHIGQYVLEKIDKILNIVETTGKWSLPQIPEGEKGSQPPLERPLSWIPFLMLIVALRSLRITLSIFALIIGNNPVSATDMVYFVQIRRRKLRSFRYQGIRALKIHQQNQKQDAQQGVFSRVASLLGRLICRPENLENTYVNIGKQYRISEEKDSQLRKQTNSSSDEEVDETVKKILEVYTKVISRDSSADKQGQTVQNKSQLNKESGVSEPADSQPAASEPAGSEKTTSTGEKEKEPEAYNGEKSNMNSEPLKLENVPENDPSPPPEVADLPPKQQSQKKFHKKGPESVTEPTRVNHQSVVAAQNHNDNQVKDDDDKKPSTITEGCHCKCSKINLSTASNSTCNLSPASSSEDLFFSPIGTPDFEFDFDEYLKSKNTTNTTTKHKVDDVHQSDKNTNTPVQNGKIHHSSHHGSKSSKRHGSRMNGRVGSGGHH